MSQFNSNNCENDLNVQVRCATCRLTYFTCPGHFGHIELPSPVYHPLFMTNMFNLLRGTCLFCHRFKLSRSVVSYRLCFLVRSMNIWRRFANTSQNFACWNMASLMPRKVWMISGDRPTKPKARTRTSGQTKQSKVFNSESTYTSTSIYLGHRIVNETIIKMDWYIKRGKTLSRNSVRSSK